MVDLKNTSTINILIEGKTKMLPSASKSTESLYSNSSSKYSAGALYKRKTAGGSNKSSNAHLRQAGYIPASNEVRQRVLSARRLRMKTLQNQITDAQLHIGELAQENRILRTLHKRQDNALSKYENTNAELPQLLHSHAEEVRVWQAKFRTLHQQNKELSYKLKQKDAIILGLTDENKHLTQLNNDKHLEEREILSERIKVLENNLSEKDNDLKLLARRFQLETKTYKNQLHNEQSRYKDVMLKLAKTTNDQSGFNKLDTLEITEKLAKATLLPKSLLNPTKKLSKTLKEIKSPRILSEELLGDIHKTKLKENSQKLNNSGLPRRLSSSLERNLIKKPQTTAVFASKTTDDLAEAIKMGMRPVDGSLDFVENTATVTECQSDYDISNEDKITKEIDKNNYDDDDDDDEDEFFDDDFEPDDDVIISSDLPKKTKKDFDSIRKKITDDYKDRETFLDSFCRESSSEALNENIKRPIDVKKKVTLLAALKSIDEKDLN